MDTRRVDDGEPPGNSPGNPHGRIRDIRVYRPSFAGMVLLACTPFLIFGASSVYGVLGTILLVLAWLVLFALGCRWFMPRPWRVVVVGVLSMLCWLAVVLFAR
jgi:hypothetical protein